MGDIPPDSQKQLIYTRIMRKIGMLHPRVIDRIGPRFAHCFTFLFPMPPRGELEQFGPDLFYSGGTVNPHTDTQPEGMMTAFLVLSCYNDTVLRVEGDSGWQEMSLGVGDVVVFDEGLCHSVQGGDWPFVAVITPIPVGIPDWKVMDWFHLRLHTHSMPPLKLEPKAV